MCKSKQLALAASAILMLACTGCSDDGDSASSGIGASAGKSSAGGSSNSSGGSSNSSGGSSNSSAGSSSTGGAIGGGGASSKAGASSGGSGSMDVAECERAMNGLKPGSFCDMVIVCFQSAEAAEILSADPEWTCTAAAPDCVASCRKNRGIPDQAAWDLICTAMTAADGDGSAKCVVFE